MQTIIKIGFVGALHFAVWCAVPGIAPAESESPSPAVENAAPSASEDNAAKVPGITWLRGSAKADIGGIAGIQVPEKFVFCGGKDTQKFLEMLQNPTGGTEVGMLAPQSLLWFVVFEFSEVGYVKDDEKDKLDAAAMLESIKKGTEASNQERKKRGWSTIEITGWEAPPNYGTETHNLQWAIRGVSEGESIVNFNTRLLGRKGYMSVALVVDPAHLATTLPEFKELLKTFEYNSGNRYAEYRQGDKIAKYGLAALVAGGAAAVAFKTGLLQKFWKLIVVAVLAIAAGAKKVVTMITGKKSDSGQA